MNTGSGNRWIYPLLVIYTVSLPSYATNNGEVSTVRLVGGSRPSEGRLEVLYNGTWGTVCIDFFSHPDGSVVCRQLGYIGVNNYSSSAGTFGAGEGPIWLDNVQCTGSEESILNCTHSGFGEHNCNHEEDVGITCDRCTFNAINVEDGALRLVGGNCYSNGRIEIFHNGEWGAVCNRRWGPEDAMVVCRQLGFQGALEDPPRSRYGEGDGTIWLSSVGCMGSESRLDECNHGGWGETSWLCNYRINDASVECEGESSILPLTTPPQTELSFLTTTYENIPSSTAPSSHTVFPSFTTTNHPSPPFTSTASQMLPIQSNSPTFQTSGDVDDHDLSQMELILGLVALGVLLLVSATLLLTVTTVCVCRSMHTKSIQVEGFQQADFSPIPGLAGDSEVILTNTNTQMSYSHASS